ncbi:MAG: hypothetical protein O3C43_14390 [Verrucomicrobia bacterium]|nr:hypothetical protein [Verrucomicrobiota bacterium]
MSYEIALVFGDACILIRKGFVLAVGALLTFRFLLITRTATVILDGISRFQRFGESYAAAQRIENR